MHASSAKGLSTRQTIRRFWNQVKPYKWWAASALTAGFLIEASLLIERYLFTRLVDASLDRTLLASILVGTLSAFAAIFVVRIILRYYRERVVTEAEARILTDLKTKYVAHIIRLSHQFHATHKSGSMIARVTRGARAIESMMDTVVYDFAPLIMQGIVSTIALTILSPTLLGIIACTAAAFMTWSWILMLKQYPLQEKANDADDVEKGQIADYISNIEAIKYFGKESNTSARHSHISRATQQANLDSWRRYPVIAAGQTTILVIGTGAIVWYTAHAVVAGIMTPGTLVFAYTLWGPLAGQLYTFMGGLRRFYQSKADYASLAAYDDEQNEILDEPNAPPMKIKEGSITFDAIRFGYQEKQVLDNFTLHIRKNEKVALVGLSGSGKSTLIKLLYRLYDVRTGSIRIDGTDIRSVQQESLRASMAIVPQETVLFDDTLFMNIAFSNPSASRAEVLRAMKLAQLDSVVARLPNGENTVVGERGIKLSGGEKQRVSIARAILANTQILVLDEATSSLDSQTEHEVQSALKQLLKNRTSIIIAHRLSTIMTADRIVVLDKGKIVQEGKHAQLIRKKGLYKQLWSLQRGGYLTD